MKKKKCKYCKQHFVKCKMMMMHHYWLFYDKLMCALKFLLLLFFCVFNVINDRTTKIYAFIYKNFNGCFSNIFSKNFVRSLKRSNFFHKGLPIKSFKLKPLNLLNFCSLKKHPRRCE